jgi:rRNA maturation endonuclease Nob1
MFLWNTEKTNQRVHQINLATGKTYCLIENNRKAIVNAKSNHFPTGRRMCSICGQQTKAKRASYISKKVEQFKNDRQKEYREKYLTSDRWQAVRTVALQRAEYKCQVCNDDKKLDVHHRSYKNKGTREEINDLVVLCRDCHSLFHDK